MTQQHDRVQQWQHPVTAERVELVFSGELTTLTRGEQVQTFSPPPFDEQAELQKVREELKPRFEWTLHNLLDWREMLEMTGDNTSQAQQKFTEAGLPLKLWDELEAVRLRLGFTRPNAQERMQPPTGAYGVQVVQPGATPESPQPDITVIDGNAPEWQGSLLFHPTPEQRRAFLDQHLQQNISVSPPPPELEFQAQMQKLKQEGFTRMTTRTPDGKLWLPPTLEPHRAALEGSEKPALRLTSEVGRTPKVWESKVAGPPYRLKGTPWPMSGEKTPRPLLFLAQLNFAELNANGQLPDFPRSGLLQFFILNTMFYGADAIYDRNLKDTNLYRVIYHPQVEQDEMSLDPEVPALVADDQGGDLNQTPFLFAPKPVPSVPLVAVPDREPVSGADDGNKRLLNLLEKTWEDEAAGQIISALYDLNPGGHKLGGYPNFTQGDPRPRHDLSDWRLLLQLDSDERLGLQWGDVGTANFFIHPDDLKARDFSRVFYHWDCG